MKRYYLLEDPERNGMVVYTEGRYSFKYTQERGWVRTGMMIDYLFPESDIYDRYREITEEEVNRLIAHPDYRF
jgi:transcriptional regulator of nitric oxide reductase